MASMQTKEKKRTNSPIGIPFFSTATKYISCHATLYVIIKDQICN